MVGGGGEVKPKRLRTHNALNIEHKQIKEW